MNSRNNKYKKPRPRVSSKTQSKRQLNARTRNNINNKRLYEPNSIDFSSRNLAKDRLNKRKQNSTANIKPVKVNKTKKPQKIKKTNYTKTKSINNKPINVNTSTIIQKSKFAISRRNLLLGIAGASVLAAGATGIKFASDKIENKNDTYQTLKIPKNSVINSENLTLNNNTIFKIKNELKLKYGTLAWANSSKYITCLIPSDKAKPLSSVDLINIDTGKKTTIIDKGQSSAQGYEIYSVRCSDTGAIWVEINILQGEWRIYCAKLNNLNIVDPILIDKGNSNWEIPSIAITNTDAFWQVLPNINSDVFKFYSMVKSVSINNITAEENNFTNTIYYKDQILNFDNVIYKSDGRMSTPLYSYNNNLVISPRLNTKSIIHKLTYIDNTGKELDSICMPENMKPLCAGYGYTGFNFSFDNIYNYGEGISNLGTYTPVEDSKKYNDITWLNFARDPYSDPAWYNNYFILRATMSVVCLDLKSKSYIVLNRPNASDDYGDFLASSGDCSKIVTYANVFDQPVSGEEQKYCCLRIWE